MYAIMVCLDGKDDWIYITEQSEDFDLHPLLFDDASAALDAAQAWQQEDKPENVMVVDYYED
jgi:hypothetical protein|tara:strand:+ start:442 stop:627 length:186 start_codon:yes stop_codon:yes gene_type:complete